MSPWPFEAPHRDPPRVSPATVRAKQRARFVQRQEPHGNGCVAQASVATGSSASRATRPPSAALVRTGRRRTCSPHAPPPGGISTGRRAGSGVATPGWWRTRATRICCCRTARWRASRRSCTRSTARATRACRCAPTHAHSANRRSLVRFSFERLSTVGVRGRASVGAAGGALQHPAVQAQLRCGVPRAGERARVQVSDRQPSSALVPSPLRWS